MPEVAVAAEDPDQWVRKHGPALPQWPARRHSLEYVDRANEAPPRQLFPLRAQMRLARIKQAHLRTK